MKLVRLIKILLSETYGKSRVGKYLSDTFPIKKYRKKGDALSPLLFNFVLQCVIRKDQANQEKLKLSVTYWHLAWADYVKLPSENMRPVRNKKEAVLVASKDIGPEARNAERTEYMFMSHEQNAGQSYNIKIGNNAFEYMAKFRYSGTTITIKIASRKNYDQIKLSEWLHLLGP
jgi:hypothetical protein